MDYLKGDRVIVYLSTQERKNKSVEYRICKVVASGEFDLICETIGNFTKIFKVSKHRCVKIDNKVLEYNDHHPISPKVGDLVISIRDTFKSDRDEFTGIVEDITYDPTTNFQPVYIVRTGQKTVRAYLENIIILESAN